MGKGKKHTHLTAGLRRRFVLLCGLAGVLAASALAAGAWSALCLTGAERVLVLCLVGIVCLLVYACLRLIREHMEWSSLKKLDEENQEEMKAFLLKQRTQRHDFNIHLMALRGMLDTERYDDCRGYLQKMLDASNEVAQLLPLDDPAVSAMLNQAISNANSRGVNVECCFYDDLHEICCDAYEINQILGNLVRNAVEAVEDLPEEQRKVTVTTLQRRNQCIFRVENALAPGAVLDQRVFSYGFSGKEQHSGIGLAAVRRLVQSHHGSIFMEQENGRVCMIVQLPKSKER